MVKGKTIEIRKITAVELNWRNSSRQFRKGSVIPKVHNVYEAGWYRGLHRSS